MFITRLNNTDWSIRSVSCIEQLAFIIELSGTIRTNKLNNSMSINIDTNKSIISIQRYFLQLLPRLKLGLVSVSSLIGKGLIVLRESLSDRLIRFHCFKTIHSIVKL